MDRLNLLLCCAGGGKTHIERRTRLVLRRPFVGVMIDKAVKDLLTKEEALTAEEEHQVFVFYRDNMTQELRNMIVEKNLGLCRYIAGKFTGMGIEKEELEQEGVIGLMTAVDRFDEDAGTKFSTYACFWIRQSVTRYIANHAQTIRLPVHIRDTYQRIKQFQNQYIKEHDHQPTADKIAAELAIPLDTVENILLVFAETNAVSLNCQVSDGDGDKDAELQAFIKDEKASEFTAEVEQRIINEEVCRLVNGLNEREKQVVSMRFGLNGGDSMTLQEVGECIGVTRERVRQIEKIALTKLRNKKGIKCLRYTG